MILLLLNYDPTQSWALQTPDISNLLLPGFQNPDKGMEPKSGHLDLLPSQDSLSVVVENSFVLYIVEMGQMLHGGPWSSPDLVGKAHLWKE